MKKLFTVILASMLMVSCAACNDTSSGSSSASSEESAVSETSSAANEISEEAGSEEVSSEEASSEENSSTTESEESASSEKETDSEKSYNFKDGVFTFEEISFTLPDTFDSEPYSTSPLMLITKDFPESTDNIAISSDSYSLTDGKLTKEELESGLSAVMDGINGIEDFKDFTIDGCEASSFVLTLTTNGVDLFQKQVYIYTEDTLYSLAFTYTDEASAATYDTVIDSITVSK